MRRYRLERDVSQKALAETAGVSLSCVASMEKGLNVSLSSFLQLLRGLHQLHLLSDFLKEPEISPIAYAKMLEGQHKRKRASSLKTVEQENESLW